MSKEFAMLTATRHLENYLSRENYNLSRMSENDRVPSSLFEKKVGQHNELVDILNTLFASLTDSASSELFPRFVIEVDEADEPVFTVIPEVEGVSVSEEFEESAPVEQVPFHPQAVAVTETIETTETEKLNEETEEEPAWTTEGYESEDAWLADKETECVQFSGDDLTVGVNDAMSRHRAGQALDEYNETSVRDIASYLPEDDRPVNVLPSDDSEEEETSEGYAEVESEGYYEEEQESEEILNENEEGITDYTYLDHTVDNVRVDNDPTQIAGVETAVERYGENARQGTDIDVSSFVYQSEPSVVDSLISEDIKQLHTFEPSDASEPSETDTTENID